MSIAPGTRFGFYEIVSALGAVGMGEGYRARTWTAAGGRFRRPATRSRCSAGNPAKLLDAQYFMGAPDVVGYEVSPGGQRFLMIEDNASGNQTSASASMNSLSL